jgi:methyl-accepting chemotaxis protein
MIQAEHMRSEQEEQKASAELQKRQAMQLMADSFESNVKTVVTGVSASASQMRGNAERLSELAGETKANSAVVASNASEAAQTASQVAAAAEELTAAIGEISAQVQKSSTVASQASTQAESINQSMRLLVEKSNRVGEVIQFITNIASQINLLALNATIESARAGEAGRGFAVVASEVKNLANQTAKATEEIIQQVQSMQEATHDAVGSVGQIINIISEISANTAGVAAAVEEQSAATNEISRTITSTADSTSAISRSIVSVEKGADETGMSSHQVLDSAKTLNEQAQILSEKVEEFLRNVRNS